MTYRINHESKNRMAGETGQVHAFTLVFGKFAEFLCSILILFMLSILLTGSVMAQETETMPLPDSTSSSNEPNQAVNMCPGGLIFGIYSANYEHLFGTNHGVVIRLDYETVSETYSDDIIEAKGYAITLNYRWHWSGGLESAYLGSYARYKVYDGTGTTDTTEFDFTMPEFTLGLNLGKRWVFDCGFNVNCAFGYGISDSSRETDPTNASTESLMNTFVDDYTFMGPFYGEISVGYAF